MYPRVQTLRLYVLLYLRLCVISILACVLLYVPPGIDKAMRATPGGTHGCPCDAEEGRMRRGEEACGSLLSTAEEGRTRAAQ
jgi:hypothetical protein